MKFRSFTVVSTALLMARANSDSSYEIWGSDQSNTVPGLSALGTQGSFIWIWDSSDVKEVIKTGKTPLSKPCVPDAKSGPCDMMQMFPGNLLDSLSNQPLSKLNGFGRWHGVTTDPQNLYVTANIFAPGGGYLGIVDVETKGAVGLFRVTLMTYDTGVTTSTNRNVHMSFWNHDGSAIIINNLTGKAVERIDVHRNADGKITSLTFNKSATVGVGKGMQVAAEASFFVGNNAFGKPLLGGLTGSYEEADLSDIISATGECKENGCSVVVKSDAAATNPGRPNNVPICPVMAPNGLIFNTFGGGGLIVMDSTTTPMAIVASYPNSLIYGAGVCGEAVGDKVYFTSGNSASGAGITHSMWALFAFDSSQFDGTTNPDPTLSFEFPGTATGGRTEGPVMDNSGQIPGITTRRDAHDVAGTVDGKYIHVIDRIKNVIDVFDVKKDKHVSTYSLITETGDIDNDESTGACYDASVADGGDDFIINDPAADFIAPTPDGKYMMISLRGPAPVSASHSAQGSCPGVGIVELKKGGKSGALVGVLRSTNVIQDTLDTVSPPGGIPYAGKERSDVHDVIVVSKNHNKGPRF